MRAAAGAVVLLQGSCGGGDGGIGPGIATTIVANSATSLTAVAGSAVAERPSVLVRNQDGQVMAGAVVTFAVTGGGGSVVAPTQTTNGSGVATVGDWILGTTAGVNTLTATTDGLVPVVFTSIGTVGTAATIVKTAGDGQTGTAGAPVPVPPSVVVRDANGNPVAGVTVTFAIASGGGSVQGGTQTTNSAGVAAPSSWVLGTAAGQNTLAVASAGLSPVTFTASGAPGPVARLAVVTAPSSSVASRTVFPTQPSVRATDIYGNAVAQSGVAVTVAISAGPGALSGNTVATTDNAGIATFSNLSIGGVVGTRTLSFTSQGLTGSSATVTITPGPASAIVLNLGNNQTALAGTAVTTTPSVNVVDADGNGVSGIAVTFSVVSGGGAVSNGNQTSNSAGTAQPGTWTLGPVDGENSLSATAAGLTGSPITFIATGVQFQDLDAGAYHTCGVTVGESLYCWGENSSGQIGDGTTANRSSPTRIGGSTAFRSVTVGSMHSCAVTSSGAGYCWGSNEFGQLGDGSTALRRSPVLVSGGLVLRRLEGGGSHTCGITTAGGAYCWGSNDAGQLGNGAGPGSSPATTPSAISGGITFASLSTGSRHTCGVAQGGVAYCWGSNDGGGQLGDGTSTSRGAPVAVGGGRSFATLAAGSYHSCAVTTSGAGYCWGRNGSGPFGDAFGALGDGTRVDKWVPTAVVGGHSFENVSAGGYNSCGITTAGVAYCWGNNSGDQLGSPHGHDNPSETVPTAVRTTLTFKRVSLGALHTCGVTTAGGVLCWGSNSKGQLGDPARSNSYLPAPIRWP